MKRYQYNGLCGILWIIAAALNKGSVMQLLYGFMAVVCLAFSFILIFKDE